MKQIDHLDAAGKTIERVVLIQDEELLVTVFDDDTYSVISTGDYEKVITDSYFDVTEESVSNVRKIFGEEADDLLEEMVVANARADIRRRLGRE